MNHFERTESHILKSWSPKAQCDVVNQQLRCLVAACHYSLFVSLLIDILHTIAGLFFKLPDRDYFKNPKTVSPDLIFKSKTETREVKICAFC